MIDTCDHPRKYKVTYFDNRDESPLLHCRPKGTNIFYIITLRIQALSLVESHDLLEDRRTELRCTKHFPIAFQISDPFDHLIINFPFVMQNDRKTANFARLYYPHFTTFRNETSEYY